MPIAHHSAARGSHLSGRSPFDLDAPFLSAEHRMLREQIRRFVQNEIVPAAHEWERARRLPRALFLRMGELGLLGLTFPEEYGGSGMDSLAAVILSEELARSGFGGVASSVTVQTDYSASHLVRVGNPEQRARYLPDVIAGRRICALGITEPGASSDLNRLATSARRDGDSYVINGRKTFITNANFADLFFIVAKTDPEAKGAKGFSLFIVERDTQGFSNGTTFEKAGWHCSDTGELVFDDCRVPAANLVGEPGQGFYHAIAGLEHERVCLAAQAAAMGELALTTTVEWLRERPAYGRRLWDLQAPRHEIARFGAELAAGKSLLYVAAARASRGEEIAIEACMLKALLPELANRILYKCAQFHGGAGFVKGDLIERLVRDARFLAVGGGSTEVMLDETAKRL